ncbi:MULTISPECIES: hypothetical protein [unclassified Burkholderia]|uniref:hypothetical protein n=1 Tax=unclassified Burkholderia TaxID=2613784 RepID=UPI000A5B16CB|nr:MULTISPECIES: hypothetical protein [unclassified Burkholderia]
MSMPRHCAAAHVLPALALLACVAAAPTRAQVDGQVVDTPLLLIADAIHTGHAHGIVAGPIAEQFRRQFNASGLLTVDVSTVRALRNPECKRLKLVWSQAGARTPNGPDTAVLTTEMNICADGSPPGDSE